jgi:hypothetical protein
VDILHVCMSRLCLHIRREGGWKEGNYFSFSPADGGANDALNGDNVTSNESARVNRVNECLN